MRMLTALKQQTFCKQAWMKSLREKEAFYTSVGVIMSEICFLVHFQFILETRRLLNTFAIMKIGTKSRLNNVYAFNIIQGGIKDCKAFINHKFS